jgi:Spy/CpxP family protein refolding chaperone
MRKTSGLVLLAALALTVSTLMAQPGAREGRGPREDAAESGANGFVTRMMTFDANQDGKLSKDEVTDNRLSALFERADTNQDGTVTKEELVALYNKEGSASGRGPAGFGPPGPGGPGADSGRRGPPGGPDGPRGRFGGPPPIGQILPAPVQEMLQLTNAQKKKLEDLQKHVDDQLNQILTEEQKAQYQQMRNRGPGGDPGDFGPPPGRNGRPPGPPR